MSLRSSGQSIAAAATRPPGAAVFLPALAPARCAMWLKTVRDSLDASIPIILDDDFDDLLARLEDTTVGARIAAAASGSMITASLASRDAALETRLSGYIDWLAGCFRRTHAPPAAGIDRKAFATDEAFSDAARNRLLKQLAQQIAVGAD